MKFFIKFILVLSVCLGSNIVYAQDNTIPTDSLAVSKQEHSPRKALRMSALCPGLGQIYNRKYWKVPIVYGGFITLGYFFNWNNGWFHKYKHAYGDLIDDDTSTEYYKELVRKVNPNFNFDDPNNIAFLKNRFELGKDYYRRNRDLSVILSAVWYALQLIDANVDAHLIDFDISDKLTFNFEPMSMPTGNDKPFIGLQCKIGF
ncbi:MAG: DUF5683 domain-containing protein [Bacteroidota bacterium]|nr:DUF5683 domain-containing protein [Bacteroidota bacterium]MDP4205401.1 DUF5683 domain-containing protein [Bacteroidota bacterium]